MRLGIEEKQALVNEIKSFLLESDTIRVLLFGSRANDSLKGGDIDIAIVVLDLGRLAQLKMIDYKILAAIKNNELIGDQKIDLKLISEQDTKNAFFTQALQGAVEIYSQ